VGEAKRRREAALLPFRPGLSGEVTDRVCEGDHEWFEANRDRKRRFRSVIAGECPERLEPGRFHYCIVTQLGPGVRMRQFVHFAAPIDRDLSEPEVAKLSAWAVNPEKHPFPFIPLTEAKNSN
jgi:hypothetical protein